ncbi:MAG: ribonuclease III domain-containing protein, partial [Cyanobacteria bacterium P01_H01_bin.121]
EKQIGYFFFNKDLLKRALTHPSFAQTQVSQESATLATASEIDLADPGSTPSGPVDQEAYAVLGHTLLRAVLTEFLVRIGYTAEADLREQLACLMQSNQLVTLAQEEFALDFLVKVSPEYKAKGKHRDPSILISTLEAVLGAIYLDGGFSALRSTVQRLFQRVSIFQKQSLS